MTLTIHVRKPALNFEGDIQRFYFGGDPVKTYVFNALNLLFPEGERYFVQAVHRYMDRIEDPSLKQAMREFAGQEGQHAHQHERFFATMERQGYRIGRFLKYFARRNQLGRERLAPALQLSLTAGAEHYTAVLAAAILESGLLSECHPTMRDLITWHAVEEIEHKSVAFDVLQTVAPNNYPLRMLGFLLASLTISGHASYAFYMLMQNDLRAGHVTRDQLKASFKSHLGERERGFWLTVATGLLKYWKPGFHPGQQDDEALAERYAAQIPVAVRAA